MTQKHILHFSEPKSLKELGFQIKIMTDTFYDASYDGNCMDEMFPVAMILRAMLKRDNVMNQLSNHVAKRLGQPRAIVAYTITTQMGLSAKAKETQWIKDNCPDDMPGPAWVNANIKALSWAAVCSEQDRLGLGCACAFCCAIYVAGQLDEQTPGHTLGELLEQLSAVKECESERCCNTHLDKLAAQYGWGLEEVEVQSGLDALKKMGGDEWTIPPR